MLTVGATVAVLGLPTEGVFDHAETESGQRDRSQPKETAQVFVHARTCCATSRPTEPSKNSNQSRPYSTRVIVAYFMCKV